MTTRTRAFAVLSMAALVSAVLTTPAVSAEAGDSAVPSSVGGRVDPVPGGFASWSELFELQGRMNAAIAEITAVADRLPASGFGAAVAAPEKRHVEIYWRGTPPAEIQAIIDQQRAVVPIVVLPAKYSLQEMLQATAALAEYPEYTEVGPMPDASGLQVRTAKGRALSAQARAARANAGVSVVITGESRGIKTTSRQDDSVPWCAGARTKTGDNACSLGFAVNHGGRAKMLYAAHCLAFGDEVDSTGQVIGQVTFRNVTRDTSLIDSDRGSGRMWGGPWNETSFTNAVQGATFSGVGNWLCTSGSVSGVRCDIQVTANNQSVDALFPMVRAERISRESAVGQGDSGGPVFEEHANGTVVAKGGITAGVIGHEAPCTDEPFPRTCWWDFVYADVTQALDFYDATIFVGAGDYRSDTTADGLADVLAQFTNGDALVYRNLGGFGFNTFDRIGVPVGTGWGGITNFALGDITGDGLADVLAQFTNGDALVYRNLGGLNGFNTFDRIGVPVGTGWGGITNFALGNVTGDALADVLAQFTNGDAVVFRNLGGLNGFNTFPSLGVLVGTGWGGITNFALGDVRGNPISTPAAASDGLADVLAQFSNGDVKVYRNNGGGLNGLNTFDNLGALTGTGWAGVKNFDL